MDQESFLNLQKSLALGGERKEEDTTNFKKKLCNKFNIHADAYENTIVRSRKFAGACIESMTCSEKDYDDLVKEFELLFNPEAAKEEQTKLNKVLSAWVKTNGDFSKLLLQILGEK